MLALTGAYMTRKALKAAIGTTLKFTETSIFGTEFRAGKPMAVVGPSAYKRDWYASVTCDINGKILKVS
jgi:hypothetical protein